MTTAFLTTSLFNAIVDEEPTSLASLEQILVGGEALSVQHIHRAWDHLSGVEIINAYGPTEVTVFACSYRIPKKPDVMSTSIPIGRSIGSTRAYICDQNMQQVPIGSTGELYLGGPGVARGYRNRPELTGQKFIADPFSKDPNDRLYKTGDLARFLADGNIDFLGRMDDQVKINGFRIELGEIEASLRRHEGVQDAIVLPYADPSGAKRLSAFVVQKPGAILSPDKLGEFLRKIIPQFMIPFRIGVLNRWPLTPSGKVDRIALVAKRVVAGKLSAASIPARTDQEKQLVQIWEELLDVRPIGIQDSFFDLGGDSLLVVRLLAQIEEVFDKRLPIAAILGAPTIEKLGDILLQEEAQSRLAYAVPIESKGEKPNLFFVGAGPLLRPLIEHLGSDQPFYSIGLKPDRAELLKWPFHMEDLAEHLCLALREMQPEGPYYLGGFCHDGIFAYEMARQLLAQGQSIGLLVLFETENPSPIARDRIAIGLRRMGIRLKYRVNQLLKLGISEIPVFAGSRWKEFKQSLTWMLWRVSHHFPFAIRNRGSADLERILFLAASKYKPKSLGCPTVIFRCKDWPIAAAGDPYMGWRELLTGRCEIFEIPGDHIGMFDESNARILADRLTACLQESSSLTPLQS